MNRNLMLGIVGWFLMFGLSLLLLFCLSWEMTATVWITFGFVCAAFLSSLVFQVFTWKTDTFLVDAYLRVPPIAVSAAYMLAQIPICIVFALGAKIIPVKATILIHTILIITAWITIIMSLDGNDHIRKVNDRQKNHHTEL